MQSRECKMQIENSTIPSLNLELGTWNLKLETWNLELGTWEGVDYGFFRVVRYATTSIKSWTVMSFCKSAGIKEVFDFCNSSISVTATSLSIDSAVRIVTTWSVRLTISPVSTTPP